MQLGDSKAGIVFKQMNVGSIDTVSGIFLGTNHSVGWSSHNKTNNGFGKANNANIAGNVFFVRDNDVLDSPVDDQDTYVNQSSRCLANNQIDFKQISVNAINRNSTISVGENGQYNWSAHGKSNSGLGQITGMNLIRQNLNAVNDSDVIDAPIDDQGK